MWIINEVNIACTGSNIILLSEERLLLEASLATGYSSIKNENFKYTADFTKNQKVFFFSFKFVCKTVFCNIDLLLYFFCREHSQNSEMIGLCSVHVGASQPNGICVKSKEIINTLYIPLGIADLNGMYTYNYFIKI